MTGWPSLLLLGEHAPGAAAWRSGFPRRQVPHVSLFLDRVAVRQDELPDRARGHARARPGSQRMMPALAERAARRAGPARAGASRPLRRRRTCRVPCRPRSSSCSRRGRTTSGGTSGSSLTCCATSERLAAPARGTERTMSIRASSRAADRPRGRPAAGDEGRARRVRAPAGRGGGPRPRVAARPRVPVARRGRRGAHAGAARAANAKQRRCRARRADAPPGGAD